MTDDDDGIMRGSWDVKCRGKKLYDVIYIAPDGTRTVIATVAERGREVTLAIKRFVYGKGSLGGQGGKYTAPVDHWPRREKSPLWRDLVTKIGKHTGP